MVWNKQKLVSAAECFFSRSQPKIINKKLECIGPMEKTLLIKIISQLVDSLAAKS